MLRHGHLVCTVSFHVHLPTYSPGSPRNLQHRFSLILSISTLTQTTMINNSKLAAASEIATPTAPKAMREQSLSAVPSPQAQQSDWRNPRSLLLNVFRGSGLVPPNGPENLQE
jgi:hypothetical protein